MKAYFITVVIVIAVVLLAEWFMNGGEHFKDVALICYGFVIGWLVAWFATQCLSAKK
jgi:uncharacterized membrane protein YfcA